MVERNDKEKTERNWNNKNNFVQFSLCKDTTIIRIGQDFIKQNFKKDTVLM